MSKIALWTDVSLQEGCFGPGQCTQDAITDTAEWILERTVLRMYNSSLVRDAPNG